ncbi:MAG: hypothetical protein ACOY17_04415 [Pseudomonadota bacterium]
MSGVTCQKRSVVKAFPESFNDRDEEVNFVDFEVERRGAETMRKTRIRRGGAPVQESEFTAIKRA